MTKQPIVLFILFGLLTACGGGGGNNDKGDKTPPTATVSPAGTDLGIHEALVITFSERMDPGDVNTGALQLSGDLSAMTEPAWSEDYTVLTLAPVTGSWESGIRTLTVNAADIAGNALAELVIAKHIRLEFEDFQAAGIVVGQPDFEGNLRNQSNSAAPDANTLSFPYSKALVLDGRLYLPDRGNNRVLGFNAVPAVNNDSADFVLGQADFSTADATLFVEPASAVSDGAALIVSQPRNVLGFSPAPTAGPIDGDDATLVLGTGATCSPTGLGNGPVDVAVAGDRLVVADSSFNRVLIWNSAAPAPGTPPDLVLGQPLFATCAANSDANSAGQPVPSASSLKDPRAVWTDGTRLVVSDFGNARLLIWNSFPTQNFAPADIVLGQADFTHAAVNDDDQDGVAGPPSARTLAGSEIGIASNGLQLLVTDMLNHRLLIWNTFPTSSFQPADVVLGQSDFTLVAANDTDQNGSTNATPSAQTFRFPAGVSFKGDRLFVADAVNHRYLIFTSN